jgi:hypothetical protein
VSEVWPPKLGNGTYQTMMSVTLISRVRLTEPILKGRGKTKLEHLEKLCLVTEFALP